ncbi:unnamed protein product, partial [Iphiclides podalirius]
MSDDAPPPSGLRSRVSFFERVWRGRGSGDNVDAAADVEEIERRIEERRRTGSPRVDARDQSPGGSQEFQSVKLRHVGAERERQVEEGDLAAGVRCVRFERVTLKRTVETRDERPDSPQHEWYTEYKQHALQTAPKKDYLRSKSEYDTHIAEIRGTSDFPNGSRRRSSANVLVLTELVGENANVFNKNSRHG